MTLSNSIRKKIIIGTWSWSGQYKPISNKKIEALGFSPAVSLQEGLNELVKGLNMFNHKPFTNV
jgi:nucleoside-diphosphate-sugar epimerase